MHSFVVIAALALTAAQATILPCGAGLGFGLGGFAASDVSSIPLGDRVVANNCQCLKTIVRPQLNQRVIDIPTTRRLVQNSISNIVQNIPYTTGGVIDTPFINSAAVAPLDATRYGFGVSNIDAVAPLGAVSGYGFADNIAPLNTVVERGYPLGVGFSGLNDVILGGDAVSSCGCGY